MPMSPFPIDLEHSQRHHRCYTKPTMDQRSNGASNWTRNKEIIFRFNYVITPQTPWSHMPLGKIPPHAKFAFIVKQPRNTLAKRRQSPLTVPNSVILEPQPQ
jgi:hypothetical protein